MGVSFWRSEMKVQLCFALLPIVALADFYRVDTEVLADNDRHAEDVNKEEGLEARLDVEAEQGAEGFERSERDSDAQFLSLGGSSLLNGGLHGGVGLVGAGHARHVNLGNGGVGLGGARLGAVGVASTGPGGVGLGVGHRHVNLGSGVGLGGV